MHGRRIATACCLLAVDGENRASHPGQRVGGGRPEPAQTADEDVVVEGSASAHDDESWQQFSGRNTASGSLSGPARPLASPHAIIHGDGS